MHCCPLPLDNQGDKAPGAGEDGTQEPGDSPAGDSRRFTPLACIHRPVKPLDGRMVVANPYLQASGNVPMSILCLHMGLSLDHTPRNGLQGWPALSCVGPKRRSRDPGTFRTFRTMFRTFLSMLILATYPVADIRPRSKPKSKLTSSNFNMLTLVILTVFA